MQSSAICMRFKLLSRVMGTILNALGLRGFGIGFSERSKGHSNVLRPAVSARCAICIKHFVHRVCRQAPRMLGKLRNQFGNLTKNEYTEVLCLVRCIVPHRFYKTVTTVVWKHPEKKQTSCWQKLYFARMQLHTWPVFEFKLK